MIFDGRIVKPVYSEFVGYVICLAILAAFIIQILLSYYGFKLDEKERKKREKNGKWKRKKK